MPIMVYTLACETADAGSVFGVYARRERAVDAARNLATAHGARLRAEDEATFKVPVAPDLYQVRCEDFRSRIVITTYHRLLRSRAARTGGSCRSTRSRFAPAMIHQMWKRCRRASRPELSDALRR